MNRRTLLGAAGWLGAALVAVAVGLAAIGIIGAGLTSRESRPLAPADVQRQLEALPETKPAPSPSVAAGQGLGAATTRTFPTRGGTVVARCDTEGRPQIVTMSPRTGFALHEQNDDEGEFRSASDNHDRVKFDVICAGAEPGLSVRSGGED